MIISGCVTIPVEVAGYQPKCDIPTSRKELKLINVAKETNTFYSITSLVSSPILIPTTALLSGSYIIINNTYYFSKEHFMCSS